MYCLPGALGFCCSNDSSEGGRCCCCCCCKLSGWVVTPALNISLSIIFVTTFEFDVTAVPSESTLRGLLPASVADPTLAQYFPSANPSVLGEPSSDKAEALVADVAVVIELRSKRSCLEVNVDEPTSISSDLVESLRRFRRFEDCLSSAISLTKSLLEWERFIFWRWNLLLQFCGVDDEGSAIGGWVFDGIMID